MRSLSGLLALMAVGALATGCVGSGDRRSGGVVPSNVYIGQDIQNMHSVEAGDMRDLRPFEPGHAGFSFGVGGMAPLTSRR